MEKQAEETIRNGINQQLIRVIISNPREKSTGAISKVKMRPILLNGEIRYQATEYIGSQVIHKNYTNSEAVEYVIRMMEHSFKQCEITGKEMSVNILVSKKGKITVSSRKNKLQQIGMKQEETLLQHNRTKNYILKEGIPVPFLIDLGVMNRQGDIIKPKYDKFRQINRFLEFVRDVEGELPKNREISVIDFGCGKSYLTFAIYYYLHELRGLDVSITGLDLKKDVIEKCNRLSNSYGYDKLIFKLGDIAEYTRQDNVDMVVTLHACDTATDYALYKAVSWNSKVILSVPCCQHELNQQIHNDVMGPVLNYGILKERMAALMTDAIRAEVLKIRGYRTDILEFIDMEHTPKNLLIRAVKSNETGDLQALNRMVSEYGVTPSIMKLFQI